MAKTLGDEYHGHQCRSTKRLHEMAIFSRNQWSAMLAEDEFADSLYMAGEMTRAEWLLAKERNGRGN